MLITIRKENEPIKIILPNGETIIINLTRLGTDGARVGIDAPRAIKIQKC